MSLTIVGLNAVICYIVIVIKTAKVYPMLYKRNVAQKQQK